MSITEPASALRARLVGFSALAALVSTRVFPMALPQGTIKPAVVYEQTDISTVSAMGTDDGLEDSFFDVLAIADSYSSMVATRRQVREALQRFSGTVDGFVIDDCFIEGIDEGYADETKEYLGSIQVKLIHQTS